MKDRTLQELASLFFSTRQIIRSRLPEGSVDPNAWLRYETMRFIADHDGPTMRDIASYLRIKAPSATSLIAHLVTRGALRRAPEPHDKRVVRLYLTKGGEGMLRTHQKRSNATMRAVFSRFSDKDMKELVRILRHLRDIH